MLPAHKGNATVVVNTKDYKTKMDMLFNVLRRQDCQNFKEEMTDRFRNAKTTKRKVIKMSQAIRITGNSKTS